MKPKHDNGKLDTRYTVTLEHTGQPTARHVARFLHQRIGDAKLDLWQRRARDN